MPWKKLLANVTGSTEEELRLRNVVMIKETVPSSWRAGDSKVVWAIRESILNALTTGDG